MAHSMRRLSQKQQRELDAKMHQALRSLMFSHYEREESARRLAILEAQRVLSGNQQQNAATKAEPASDEEQLADECDLELEPRMEVTSLPAPSQPKPPSVMERAYLGSHVNTRTAIPSTSQERPYQNGDVPPLVGEVFEALDESLDERAVEEEPLFDNELTEEQKVQLTGDASAIYSRVVDHYPEVQLDVDTEITIEELKTLSLDDVCVRMACCAHAVSSDDNFKHSTQWYMGMMKTCWEAIATHEYPRPHLPFEVERLLDVSCDKLNENWRNEEERNLRKLEKRSIGCTASFDCVYPVAKETLVENKLLLTGITGNANLFFNLYLKGVHMKDEKNCYPDCVCYLNSCRSPNVMHLAAAHGNAEFIKKLLFPEKTLPEDPVVRNHYQVTIKQWVCSVFESLNIKMYPFDVAVLYDNKDCARELLGCETVAKMLRERPFEMAKVRCSLPFREYIESPLSIAVYYGNLDMIRMLLSWQLIKPQHFPQAFREAASAGDVTMLRELWVMAKNNLNLMVEQELPGDRKARGSCTPLHVAAAAGQLRAVEFLCRLGQWLRTKPDAAGDLPLTYAIENGHMAVVEYLMNTFPEEVSHTVIRSAIACKRNTFAKDLFHRMINLKEVIDTIRPLKFAVDVENFHCAEYFLKQYMIEKKVYEPPWAYDIAGALNSVLRCRSLSPEKKTKFVIAFQLAGVKISMVYILKIVSDRSVAALICNSLRNSFNQLKT